MAAFQQILDQYSEFGHGKLRQRLVIADTYAEALQTEAELEGFKVDVFRMDNIKRDLDIETGTYATDEIEISIIEAAARTDAELDAVALALEARDRTQKRYVVLSTSEQGGPEVVEFRGVLLPELEWQDQFWHGDEYDGDIAPVREYKMTASVFDVGVLDLPLDAIVTHIRSNPDWAAYYQANFLPKYAYGGLQYNGGSSLYGSFWTGLIDVNVGLRLLADAVQEMQAGSVGAFNIIFDPSPIPARFRWFNVNPRTVDGYNSPYIQDGVNGYSYSTDTATCSFGDGENGFIVSSSNFFPNTKSAQTLSFWRAKTFGSLLFSLAQPFGMYPRFYYDESGDLHISFLDRQNLVGSEIEIRDARSADGSVEPLSASDSSGEKDQSYRSQTTLYTGEGAVVYKREYANASAQQGGVDVSALDTDTSGAELLLSIGLPVREHKYTDPVGIGLPFANADGVVSKHVNGRTLHGVRASGLPYPPWPELGEVGDIMTQIFVRTNIADPYTPGVLSPNLVMPASAIAMEIGGETVERKALADMATYIVERDGEFYKAEYKITVPYLCGFRQGGTASYFNLQLGATVTLDSTQYVVVGYERSRERAETSVRLHVLSRFAIAIAPGVIGTIAPDDLGEAPSAIVSAPPIGLYPLAEEINNYDFVVLLDDGLLYRALPIADHYGRVLGIVPDAAAAAGGYVSVFDTGEVTVTGASLTPGARIFLRTGTPNWSETPLASPSNEEHVAQPLGLVVASGKIRVRIGRALRFDGYPTA